MFEAGARGEHADEEVLDAEMGVLVVELDAHGSVGCELDFGGQRAGGRLGGVRENELAEGDALAG